MNKLLIHIGYQKTGTTWQQAHLFNNEALGLASMTNVLAELACKDKASQQTRTQIQHAIPISVVMPHDYEFDAAVCRAHFEPALQRTWQSGLLPVVSHERLSGENHTGRRDGKMIADRLASVFPEAHILIVIREQRAMFRSVYGQYIKGSGVWNLKEYLDPMVTPDIRFKYARFRLDRFCYDRAIHYYQTLFTRKNVTVLPYELFRSAPVQFLKAILDPLAVQYDCADIESLPLNQTVNPSLSSLGLTFKRKLNRLVGQRTPLNPVPLLPFRVKMVRLQRLAFRVDRRLPAAWKSAADARMAQQIEARLGDYFVESNRRSSELIGIDLAQYGYKL